MNLIYCADGMFLFAAFISMIFLEFYIIPVVVNAILILF